VVDWFRRIWSKGCANIVGISKSNRKNTQRAEIKGKLNAEIEQAGEAHPTAGDTLRHIR